MIVTQRETEAETEAGSMHREPDVGFDPASPGSRPGPKAGAKPLRHPGIPSVCFLGDFSYKFFEVKRVDRISTNMMLKSSGDELKTHYRVTSTGLNLR